MAARPFLLTDRHLKVLAAIQFDADISVASVSKVSRLPSHSVRSIIDSLLEHGIIRRFWYVNPHAFGLSVFNLYFSLRGAPAPIRAKLDNYLVESKSVVFVTRLAGRFNYCATVQAQSLADFVDFSEDLASRFGRVFGERSVSTSVSLTDYPLVKRRVTSNDQSALRIGAVESAVKLDELDSRLLTALLADSALTTAHVAKREGLASSTVAFRLSRLKERGVIVGSRYFIDVFKLGYSFACHHISCEGMGREEAAALTSYFSAHPAVYFVERCLGEWEFSVGTVLRDPSDLTTFIQDLGERFGSLIARLETMQTCGFLKLNGTPYEGRAPSRLRNSLAG